MIGRRAGVVTAFVALLAGAGAAVGSAHALPVQTNEGETAEQDQAAVLSPLAVFPVATPSPVRASDDLVHVVYELFVANQSGAEVRVDAIDVVDPSDDAVLTTYDGETMGAALHLNGGLDGTTFGPGATGYVFADVTFDADTGVPSQLEHRFSLTVTPSGGAAQELEFTGVPVRVSPKRAVVVAPPLKGGGWVVGNGCCLPPTAHRAATLSINGTVHAAERFAIDFVQLGDNDALVQGDRTVNEDYGYFGDDVFAAASGTVVNTQDGLPEQVPGALPVGQTVQTAGGNYVVVDIGRGRYAFYAHFQPGSLEVKVGDTVKTGQVLGKLGNTGNTDGAHLHFHVMDGPSPLLSNGIPFVFTSFEGEGLVTDEPALVAGQPVTLDTDALSGTHRREYPLNLEVIAFPE